MPKIEPGAELPPEANDNEEEPNRRMSLAALLIAVLLVIAGIVLVDKLRKESALEDCLASGRRNCQPIDVPRR